MYNKILTLVLGMLALGSCRQEQVPQSFDYTETVYQPSSNDYVYPKNFHDGIVVTEKQEPFTPLFSEEEFKIYKDDRIAENLTRKKEVISKKIDKNLMKKIAKVFDTTQVVLDTVHAGDYLFKMFKKATGLDSSGESFKQATWFGELNDLEKHKRTIYAVKRGQVLTFFKPKKKLRNKKKSQSSAKKAVTKRKRIQKTKKIQKEKAVQAIMSDDIISVLNTPKTEIDTEVQPLGINDMEQFIIATLATKNIKKTDLTQNDINKLVENTELKEAILDLVSDTAIKDENTTGINERSLNHIYDIMNVDALSKKIARRKKQTEETRVTSLKTDESEVSSLIADTNESSGVRVLEAKESRAKINAIASQNDAIDVDDIEALNDEQAEAALAALENNTSSKVSLTINKKKDVRERPTQVFDTIYHTVARGDTFTGLCKQYTGSYKDYKKHAAQNKLKNPSKIYPGKKLFFTVKKN